MRYLWLIDNSVVQRIRSPLVQQALDDLEAVGELTTCLPLILEEGYFARSAADHRRIVRLARAATTLLPPTAAVVEMALAIQMALFDAGKGRSVGVSDLQIAATAIAHSSDDQHVVVVHYDADFDHVASVMPSFHSRWIAPRGTID